MGRSDGVWNLWLRRMNSVDDRRITHAKCNDVSPSWESDSRTLLLASDCGCALGLTALYRQRVLP
jgi:Tol biopolymer transport system component